MGNLGIVPGDGGGFFRVNCDENQTIIAAPMWKNTAAVCEISPWIFSGNDSYHISTENNKTLFPWVDFLIFFGEQADNQVRREGGKEART